MTPELFASAAAFAIAGSFTPGPNNAMLLASGVNYGFQRTVPHIAGVTIGYGVMFAAVGLGVGRFIVENPTLHGALKIASAVYLVWLAWRIATAEGEPAEASASRPMTFLQAALFQWINPKGVAMALAAVRRLHRSALAARGPCDLERVDLRRVGRVRVDMGAIRAGLARLSDRRPAPARVQRRHGAGAAGVAMAAACLGFKGVASSGAQSTSPPRRRSGSRRWRRSRAASANGSRPFAFSLKGRAARRAAAST